LPEQEEKNWYDEFFERRTASFAPNTRLTPERIESLKISKLLSKEERAATLEVLRRREGVLS
jgi:hypothetical protein